MTLAKAAGSLKLSVKDQGQGMSEEDQQNLFKGFQKLSARPTGGEKSTGLGLTIVKSIVDAHKGQIQVESEVGKGTTFEVIIPLEPITEG